MNIPRSFTKIRILFGLRILTVGIGLCYVFLTHVYKDTRAVDGPITFGFPLPTCSTSSGFEAPPATTCSRLGQTFDILSAFAAATLIMLFFQQLSGRHEPHSPTFPSSS